VTVVPPDSPGRTASVAPISAARYCMNSSPWPAVRFRPTGSPFASSQTESVRAVGVKVTVKGGYAPDVIVVKQDQPVRLDFYRDETASCSEQVKFPDFGITRDLPAFKTTPIEFTPANAGEFKFTCGMNMMRGKLIVQNEAEGGGAKPTSVSHTHA
jgi:plastocyanin domain-containing protein